MADAIASYRAAFPLSSPAIFYSLKANSLAAVIEALAPLVDGFSVSSLFEAKLAKEVAPGRPVHYVSPCLRADEADELAAVCETICCNSFGQFELASRVWRDQRGIGLRVDPELSFVGDARYDPCRPYSKLGMPLADVARLPVSAQPGGVCFHNNSESEQFGYWLKTAQRVVQTWPWANSPARWLNLGGGYLPDAVDAVRLDDYLLTLKDGYGIERIVIEPGFGVVNAAGFLTATVTDVFDKGGKTVVLLDTTINHLPEVLEFGAQPELLPQHQGEYPCLLAGASCLAGDLFGEYGLEGRPEVGSRLTFSNVGAYSAVKANMFNGINLPDVYMVGADGGCRHCPAVGYEDYKRIWGRA